ncbi:15-hydroxyprostaglandin dehydrogenase [NAD(+)]-like [Dendronephthya gigantea]|uniref:15-hydroxyprostaglandin dehydrogenase [NAD(+)]-like n=1 Tax=Dendronephthya gigantea TaxID=151771 RepID=UPI00106CEBC5|nr:15-hydroxyprostaglandin dehydrogenase [NAD(+)]-like [Dendronephthya gigantea]
MKSCSVGYLAENQQRPKYYGLHAIRLSEYIIILHAVRHLCVDNCAKAIAAKTCISKLAKMKIDEAVAVVTGGARGIGFAITRALLAHRAKKVIFVDVDEEQGKLAEKDLKDAFGEDHVSFFKCDVTNGAEFQSVVKKISEQNDGINIFCNNAGVLDNEDWRRMIDINLTAMIHGTMIAIDLLDKQKNGHGGVIVNIASLAGLIPYEFSPVYAASKHGVIGFTRSVVQTSLDKGIRLNLICPAFVNTRMTTGITDVAWVKMIQDVGCVTPDLVAKAFLQLVKDDSCNGQALRVTLQNGIDFHSFLEVSDLVEIESNHT